MSALAGIFAPSDEFVPPASVRSIGDQLETMGPDGEAVASGPGIAMLVRAFRLDPRSTAARFPLLERNGYLISLDGRIDNLEDIARGLRAGSQATGSEHPECAAVLAAYAQLGINAFGRLIGDFAFVLWDPHQGHLVLGRDPMDRRPLFYKWSAGALWWASRARALRSASGAADVDPDFIADFIANVPSKRSPFRGIAAVPAGHVVVVSRAGVREQRFWSPAATPQLSYRSDREYEEHFRELFTECVRCRMDTSAPVVCEVSGGLDSSSIACVADTLMREGRVRVPRLHTVSYQLPPLDESPFVESVERVLGRQGLHVPETACPLFSPVPTGFAPDFPTHRLFYLAHIDMIVREMQRLGARILLSGLGGDQVFWSRPPAGVLVADDLAQGQMERFTRRAREWSDHLGIPFWTIAKEARSVVANGRRQSARYAPWFAERFVEVAGLDRREYEIGEGMALTLPSQVWQFNDIWRVSRLFALESCSSAGFMEYRYPFLDRRLAEFALALPVDQKARVGEPRSIVRRSLRGRVPDPVLDRPKIGPQPVISRAIQKNWSRVEGLFQEARTAEHGFVDRDVLMRHLLAARDGPTPLLAQLVSTISLELWLRTLEYRPEPTAVSSPDRASAQTPEQV